MRLLINVFVCALCGSAADFALAGSASFRDDFEGSTLNPNWVITSRGRLGATDWLADNVFLRGGNLVLRHRLKPRMNGAELKWKGEVLYGTLSARIKSGRADGVLSTLFLYGEIEDRVHEIDVIELFPDQAGAPNLTSYMDWEEEEDGYRAGPHYFHSQPDLEGFDCREWHVYALRWEPQKVTWIVDGKEVAWTDKVVPFKPISIMLNSWHPDTWAKAEPEEDSEQLVDWVAWEDQKPVESNH